MRIAHFLLGRCNPESANGIDKTVYYLSKAQASLGHDVVVVGLSDKPAIAIPSVRVSTVAPPRIPLFSGSSRLGQLLDRGSFRVPEMAVKELFGWQPDVLHLHSVHVSRNVALARRARSERVPYCVSLHGSLSRAAQRRNRWRKRAFGLLCEKRYLERAAFVHAVSHQDIEGLEAYGARNEIVLSPNGIDMDSLPIETDRGALTREFPELSGRRIFMFLGRLDPDQKGLDLLLRAFAEARPPAASLVLVGPDWRNKRAYLESSVTKLRLADRVVFTGPVYGQQKYDFLAAADVFVHTSRWEGLPFSVLEAAAMGKPLLLTAAADPYGITDRYAAGVSVDLTVSDISSAIAQLSSVAGTDLAEMGARSRAAMRADFGWIPTARKLMAAYELHSV